MVEYNQEKVWNKIAQWWIKYRVHSLQEVQDFLRGEKGKILDLGCGSGRNFQKTAGVIYGVDFSEQMLNGARKKAKELGIKAVLSKQDIEKLDFPDEFFDSAICIAVLHAIKGKIKRKKIVKELFRVLKPEAKALISVWDKDQKRFQEYSKQGYRDWKADGKAFKRYNYLFDKQELIDLLKDAGFKIVRFLDKEKVSKFSKKNLIIEVKK